MAERSQTLRELGAKGVTAAVVFSSRFSEVGGDGVALERELKTAIRESGVRVLGPNCLGLINAFENVMATFSQFSLGPTPPGPAAFVTQSGALGTATAGMARRRRRTFEGTGPQSSSRGARRRRRRRLVDCVELGHSGVHGSPTPPAWPRR